MAQRVPRVTRADVERIVARDFPPADRAVALAIVDEYKSNEPHRVQLAALKIAAGNLKELRAAIADANADYRDVLVVAEYPRAFRRPPGEPQSDALEAIYDADWQQYEAWLTRK